MIKNVVWDWNGTLLDDATVAAELFNAGFLSLGKAPIPLDQMRKAYTIPIQDFYLSLGLSVEEFQIVTKDFLQKHTEIFPSIQLRNSVIDTLNDFNTRGLQQFVLSSHIQALLEEGLETKSIRRYFTSVYGLSVDGAGRSKLEIGRSLLANHRLTAEETVLIGDSVHDFEVASALGIGCVLVSGGHQCESKLIQTGAPVVANIDELANILSRK